MKITEDQLAELEALEKSTTEGPWIRCVDSEGITDKIYGGECYGYPILTTDSGHYTNNEADMVFIARAKTAVPELIAEVRNLQTRLHYAEKSRDRWSKECEVWEDKAVDLEKQVDRLQAENKELREYVGWDE